MFDLKKNTVVHDVEPAIDSDAQGNVISAAADRNEPTLNIDPPEAIEPVAEQGDAARNPGGNDAAVQEATQSGAGDNTGKPADPVELPRQRPAAEAAPAGDSGDKPPVGDANAAQSSAAAQNASTAASPGESPAGNGKQDIPQFGLPVDMRNVSPKIGAILVANGKMAEPQVQEVLDQQGREPASRFGELSVRNRFTSQKDVDDALASQFGFTSNSQAAGQVAPDIVVAHNPFSPFAEALRGLRSQLMLRWFDGSPQQGALAMTSVDRADGKSFICANLGVVFSQLGEKTLIIDADLRNSTQHLKFGVQNRMGLSGLLSGRAGMEEILAVPGLNNLAVLPAGPLPPNPQELLGRESFSQFLAAMSGTFDVILIDTPSAQQASDAQVVAQRARAALIVGRKDKTKSSEISQLGQVLTSSGVKLLGATLNTY